MCIRDRDNVAATMWNDGRIIDVNIAPNTAQVSGLSSAYVTLIDRTSALNFWFAAESWWVSCDPSIGHKKFPFRWLSL
eukprot:10540294-Heterocapsa_arctica.AAC.1